MLFGTNWKWPYGVIATIYLAIGPCTSDQKAGISQTPLSQRSPASQPDSGPTEFIGHITRVAPVGGGSGLDRRNWEVTFTVTTVLHGAAWLYKSERVTIRVHSPAQTFHRGGWELIGLSYRVTLHERFAATYAGAFDVAGPTPPP